MKNFFQSRLARFTILALCEVGMVALSAVMLSRPASAQLSEEALKQIEILQKEKEGRSPIQRKIDSQLLYEVKKSRGETIEGVPPLKTGIQVDENGRVLVDVKAKITDGLLQQIQGSGGEIVYSSVKGNTVRAKLPISQVEFLASNNDVAFIEPAAEAATQIAPR
jgi:hypothetical protein